ncbi:MAG: class II aldolase/adducin family protein [Syntrophaceae bacterium]|nr:class II aldolase/adducin family protein [Syntrophaceae bacterium]
MEEASAYTPYRESVLAAGKWLSQNGFFGTLRGTGGNVSQRIENRDVLAITPTSKRYDELSPEDICVVDFNETRLAGSFSPSIELAMHIAAYRARPDATAIVHTHSNYASVFAVINRPVPALFEEVLLKIGSRIEIVPFASAGSRELAEKVAEKLQTGAWGYIIQNHGALALGSTMDEALLNAELIEKVCCTYYRALATGLPVTDLPADAARMFQL